MEANGLSLTTIKEGTSLLLWEGGVQKMVSPLFEHLRYLSVEQIRGKNL
jgi:hypothetical protein